MNLPNYRHKYGNSKYKQRMIASVHKSERPGVVTWNVAQVVNERTPIVNVLLLFLVLQ